MTTRFFQICYNSTIFHTDHAVVVIYNGRLAYYASVGGATRHTVVRRFVIHYASVGGATRHTVIALSVVLSVCLSVTPFLRRTLNGEL